MKKTASQVANEIYFGYYNAIPQEQIDNMVRQYAYQEVSFRIIRAELRLITSYWTFGTTGSFFSKRFKK